MSRKHFEKAIRIITAVKNSGEKTAVHGAFKELFESGFPGFKAEAFDKEVKKRSSL